MASEPRPATLNVPCWLAAPAGGAGDSAAAPGPLSQYSPISTPNSTACRSAFQRAEHEALLRLIGTSILDPRVAEADDEPPAGNTRREWSDGEVNELGNMLVRGVPLEEIARVLRRDKVEVQDKVVEIGRACRRSAPTNSEPARVFEDRISPGDLRVEWFDDDGGCEVAIFSGPNARERAVRYADRQYGHFEENTLSPYP